MTALTRRQLVAGLAAAVVAPDAPAWGARTPPRAGLQLYMLGPEAFRDLPATLAAVRAIGYTEVELPSLLGKPPAVLGAMLNQAGLRCPSVHVPLGGGGFALGEPSRVVDALGAVGATYAIVPMAPMAVKPVLGQSWPDALAARFRDSTADDWRRIAERLNEAGSRMAASGGIVGYHNHDAELRRLADGSTPLGTLINETDPRIVFELDIGWTIAAGVDPADYLRRHRGRVALVHLKDVASTSTMAPAEPGQGKVNWASVRRAIVGAGVRHVFVEQEPPFSGTRIDAARRAFAFFNRPAWTVDG